MKIPRFKMGCRYYIEWLDHDEDERPDSIKDVVTGEPNIGKTSGVYVGRQRVRNKTLEVFSHHFFGDKKNPENPNNEYLRVVREALLVAKEIKEG